jgi:cellulose biosynthesis protein BcsQ
MPEDNLIIPIQPEFKLHNSDHIWDQVIELHRKRMNASHIAFHMNLELSLIKDILEYIKTNEYASK